MSLKQRYQEIHEEEILLDGRSTIDKIKKQPIPNCCMSLLFIVPFIFISSVLLGSLFYCLHEDWDIYTSIFYTTQALLGCMYGVPGTVDDMASNIFTLLIFVYGSTLLAGSIGYLATNAVDYAIKQQRQRLKLYTPVDEDHDGIVGLIDWLQFYINNTLVFIGWNNHHRKYLTFIAMFVWIFIGVYYGMAFERYDMLYSVYFSIAAISGSGAAPPACIGDDDSNCSLGSYRAMFMIIYLTVGVPLFTLTLGQFSLAIVENAVRNRELDAMLQPLTEEEYEFACTLDNRDQNSGIDFATFLCMEMLRLKRFDKEDIKEIKELFDAIDFDASGFITTEKLRKCHLFCVQENSKNNDNYDNDNDHDNDNDNQYNTNATGPPSSASIIYNNLLNNLRNQPQLTREGDLNEKTTALRRNSISTIFSEDNDGRLQTFSKKMRRNSVDTNNYIEEPNNNRKPFQS